MQSLTVRFGALAGGPSLCTGDHDCGDLCEFGKEEGGRGQCILCI